VAETTRQRVLNAIDELGYRPSPTARRLSLGRTQTVGVIAPFFTQSSVVERLRGIDDVLGASNYDLTIFNVETVDQRDRAFGRFAVRERVDGAIVISLPLSDAEVDTLKGQRLPTVVIDVEDPRLPHVAVDDVEGGRLAARHLLDAGHRRIGFVGYPDENPLGMASSGRRLQGLRTELEAAGVGLPDAYVRRGGAGREAARRLSDELLALEDPPTAIFVASDVQAFGVLAEIEQRGLTVPGDVSVLGFDDIELGRAIGLTTVHQPLRASGRRGAQLLLRELGAEGIEPLESPGGLVVVERRTVGPAPDRRSSA
jgi:DNA-binding LacI/PurR family transcriptional regulator